MRKLCFTMCMALFSTSLYPQTEKGPGNTSNKSTDPGVVYIDVYISQPDIENCYTETSVEMITEFEWINLFPNPGKGNFTLEIASLVPDELITINAFSPAGESVYQTVIISPGERISADLKLQHLKSGIYFILISTDRMNSVRRLIVL